MSPAVDAAAPMSASAKGVVTREPVRQKFYHVLDIKMPSETGATASVGLAWCYLWKRSAAELAHDFFAVTPLDLTINALGIYVCRRSIERPVDGSKPQKISLLHQKSDGASMQELYDEKYYKCHCGPDPYERTDAWLQFFGNIAQEVIRSLSPRTVFDAGCAWGFLVEGFWDRGVEAKGIDISQYAIEQVRRDMQPFCSVGSLTDPIDGRYDLVTCIEVLEHMPADQAEQAIANLCQITDTILFSSSPTDLTEDTHFNVQPPIGWLKLFAKYSFAPDLVYDASFLVPHAILFRKHVDEICGDVLILYSEKIRLRLAMAEQGRQLAIATAAARHSAHLESIVHDLTSRSEQAASELTAASAEAARAQSDIVELRKRLDGMQADGIRSKAIADESQAENARLNAYVRHITAELEVAVAARERLDLRVDYFANLVAKLGLDLKHAGEQINDAHSYRAIVEKLAQFPTGGSLLNRSLVRRIKAISSSANELIFSHRQRQIAAAEADFNRSAALLADSELFDTAWYLRINGDVAEAGADPIRHYLTDGAAEGRDPGPRFSTRAYLDRYPAVQEARLNPLVHYLEYGRAYGFTIIGPSHEQTSSGVDPGARDHASRSEADLKAQVPPDTSVLAHEAALLADSELFDPTWYLRINADVAETGANPFHHYLTSGAAEGRDPGPRFSTRAYLERYPAVQEAGLNPLVHYLEHGRAHGLTISGSAQERTVAVVIDERFQALKPLPVFRMASMPPRVVVVTDSINAGSLYGGVGTALILTALLAERLSRPMCIATRTEEAEQHNVSHVLNIHGIPFSKNIEFSFVPSHGSEMLMLGDDDIVITTSWWTTHATLRSVPARQIVYLIQEDETMFYPYGDERLLCCDLLNNQNLKFVVNSKLLYDHFRNGAQSNVAERGFFFEPCFPTNSYHRDKSARDKSNFMFYARPFNSRNLYFRGLEVVETAIARGLLKAEEWDFHFVGKDLEPIALAGGVLPILHQNMSWSHYADLIRRTDLALSLMYTPHPSYPPLDVVASGGIAVTNCFGNKLTLANYSKNLICKQPSVESLLAGLEEGIALVNNHRLRISNFEENLIQRDWISALLPTLEFIITGKA